MGKIYRVSKGMRAVLAVPSKKRTTKYVREIQNSWGRWTITAKETINAYDFKVLSAFFTYIYEQREDITDIDRIQDILRRYEDVNKEERDIAAKELEQFLETTFSTEIGLHEFATKYMLLSKNQIGKKTYASITASFVRLKDMSVTAVFEERDRKVMFSVNPLPVVKIVDDKKEEDKERYTIKLTFFGTLLAMFEHRKSIFINNDAIQKANTYLSTLLVFLLMINKTANCLSYSFLKKELHLEVSDKHRHALRDIRKAFDDLVRTGFLKAWHEEKRSDDIYFSFIRAKDNTLPTKKKPVKRTPKKR